MLDKSFSQAPQGIDAIDPSMMGNEEPDLEIEIEDPEAVNIKMGDMEIDMTPGPSKKDFDANLAEFMDEGVLASIASELLSDFDDDIASRKDWMQTYVDGLELLGLKIEERSEPWEGACGVYHPLLAEAIVKFQAETVMETLPAAGPVKTQIIGRETPEKKDAAQRVQDDMNYRITDEMLEYRPEHERMVWGLGLAGNAFKKVYFDPDFDRPASMFVSAEDLVVPYGAASLETSPRITHVMRKTENEIRKLQVAGFYRDVDLGNPVNSLDEIEKKIAEKMGFRATSDDRYKILEMHVDRDLEGYEDEDGIALPYVITIERGTANVLAIRRNWKKEDKLRKKRNHFVHYSYIPGFGFYAFGLIHLIGAFAKSGTSLIRQLVDAGTLANLPGGFKTRGLRIKGDDTPIAPGEFRDVDVPSGTMRDNVMPLPYKEPSQVLMSLLNQIVEDGRRFANTADLTVSDMSAAAPVGTTLAILERTLKVMSAVQARIHYAMKLELCLLRDIIRDDTPPDYDYEPENAGRRAKQSDYDMCDIHPVSDPNAATMAQKIVQYQAVLQLAQQQPQLFNMALLYRQMLDVLGIKNAQKLVKLDEDMTPTDPITENQNIIALKPVKAFLYQDHQAHITVHMSAMQDPKIMQIMGQNPMAQQMQSAMNAHVAEHLGYEYRKQMEQAMGITLPEEKDEGMYGEQETIPKDMEIRISQLAAKASQQLLQKNQQEAQAQQNQQAQQDPLIQLQQQDLQIKQQDLQRKIANDKAEQAYKQQQLQLEHMRIDSQNQQAGLNAALKAKTDSEMNDRESQRAGLTSAIDMTKHMTNLQHQQGQQQNNLEHQTKQKRSDHAHQHMTNLLNQKEEPKKETK
jgi:hypothetical protein